MQYLQPLSKSDADLVQFRFCSAQYMRLLLQFLVLVDCYAFEVVGLSILFLLPIALQRFEFGALEFSLRDYCLNCQSLAFTLQDQL